MLSSFPFHVSQASVYLALLLVHSAPNLEKNLAELLSHAEAEILRGKLQAS